MYFDIVKFRSVCLIRDCITFGFAPVWIKRLAVEWRKGLYNQLAWAADNLNRGYYLWRVNGVPIWILSEGTIISIDPSINAATAGIQHYFSQLYDGEEWERAVNAEGLFATYNDLQSLKY